MALTGKNEIVGTLYYMSPEQLQAQANGQEIDARSDIFSFGLVLYEMLTGKRAFEGSSPASVIAAIMERPAPSIADVAPPALDRVLKTCLAKDPDERWQSARDLKRELEWIASAPGDVTTVPTALAGRLPWIAAAGVLAVVAAALGFFLYRATRPAELKPLVHLDVDLGSGVSNSSPRGADTIISPGGTRLVYVLQNRLFTRRLDQSKANELAGTEGAFAPFFSPDGQWVAFFAEDKLKKISVEGGAALTLCDSSAARGGSWGEDGSIIAALSPNGVLTRIPSAGGAPTPLTEPAQGEFTERWPQILPGGKAVLFTSHTSGAGFDGANIEVMSLADHRRKTLQRGGAFGRYLPASNGPGHLVYINKGTLFAVPFDLDELEVRGTPSPVLDQVAYSPGAGFAQFDFSSSGTLVYKSGGAAGGSLFTAQWLDAAGKTQPLLAKADAYLYPRLSPDGTRLAVSAEDIWVYEWQRDTMTRLSFTGTAAAPVWSPDGRYIVFANRGHGGMFWTRSDGAGTPQPLIHQVTSMSLNVPYSFTPDGKRLAFHEAGSVPQLWTVPIESDSAGLRAGKPEPFLQSQFSGRQPSFSADGVWLAYASNESGVYQIYVRAFPDKGDKWQISNGGGLNPVFSPNGRELFFRNEANRIMVAEYATKGDSFVAGKARVWSEKEIGDTAMLGSSFDVAPDGKRIAVLMPVERPETQRTQNRVIFLENFSDELRRKVPTGK